MEWTSSRISLKIIVRRLCWIFILLNGPLYYFLRLAFSSSFLGTTGKLSNSHLPLYLLSLHSATLCPASDLWQDKGESEKKGKVCRTSEPFPLCKDYSLHARTIPSMQESKSHPSFSFVSFLPSLPPTLVVPGRLSRCFSRSSRGSRRKESVRNALTLDQLVRQSQNW